MGLRSKDLLDFSVLSLSELQEIFQNAKSMKEIMKRDIKKVPTLRGRTIINLFYENSTRTRSSFELAGKYMSADVINVSSSTSSVSKGETLWDTARTLDRMSADIIIMRHPASGSHQIVSQAVKARVINAGDGTHQHPTQALLDLFTILEYKNELRGRKIAIVGDILHSRVARSNITGMLALGADVWVCGPPTLMPAKVESLGVKVTYNMEEAVRDADVVMMLRIQQERQNKALIPSIREYANYYCLNEQKIQLAKTDVLVLHPGPINRGVEISSKIADGLHSVIEEQVTNGVAIRMALLYLMTGGINDATA